MPYSRPADIFNGVPGVASAGGSNGAGLQVNIRGLQGMGRVKTLIDGTIQSASTYKGYPGNREDTYIDPDLIGGIDIKKGPDAGPQGAGVVGGIVSMRTINARDLIIDPDKNWGLRIKGMYGNNVADSEYMTARVINGYQSNPAANYFTYDTYNIKRSGGPGTMHRQSFRDGVPQSEGWTQDIADFGGPIPDKNYSASIALGWQPLENWEVTFAHAIRQSGNYYAGNKGKNSWQGLRSSLAGSEVYNSSLNSETYLFKNKFTFLENHSLELGYIKYRNQSGFANAAGNVESDYAWQQILAEAESHTYTLNYAWQSDNPWFDVRANLWKNRLTSQGGIFAITGADNEVISDNIGGELWNTSHIMMPLGELDLTYGLSFANEDAYGKMEPREYQDYVSYSTMVNAERKSISGFINAEYSPTHWLTFNAGIRRDKTDLSDNKQPLPPYLNNLTPEPDRSFSSTSPNFSVVFQPHESVQLYAQWSKGERAPSLREAYIQANSVMPNSKIKTEKADNFEYGVNFLFNDLLMDNDQLGIKLSYFKNDYKDYIVRLHRAAMGELERYEANYYKFANIDKAQYEGYEISVDYDAGWVFASFGLTRFDKVKYCYPGYTGRGSAAEPWQALPSTCHAQPNQSDFGASYIPPTQEKSATLGFRLLDQKLVFGANMNMSTESMYGGSFRGAYVGRTVWDDYEIYDLFGSYKPHKNLEIGFSVENVTDRFYVPSYSDSLTALPAPGRTVRGMLTLHF